MDIKSFTDLEDQALRHFSRENFEEAKGCFDRLLSYPMGKGDPHLLLYHARALIHLGHFKDAQLSLDKVLENSMSISKWDGRAYLEKSLIYYLRGDIDTSREFLERALKTNIALLEEIPKDPRFEYIFFENSFAKLLMPTREYQVNKQITLKQFFSKTYVYVCGELFRACSALLISIPLETLNKFDKLTSIDEVIDKYQDLGLPKNIQPEHGLTPEQEFWGHCSNIEAWVEHNYDTRLISSSFGFAILKKLADKGDQMALIRFKEEVINRMKENYDVIFMINYKFFSYFSQEELLFGLLELEEAEIMQKIADLMAVSYAPLTDMEFSFYEPEYRTKGCLHYYYHNSHIQELEIILTKDNLKVISLIERLPHLKRLYIFNIAGVKFEFSGFKRINKYIRDIPSLFEDLQLLDFKKFTVELRPLYKKKFEIFYKL